MTTPILSIPLEIIEQALVYSDPRDDGSVIVENGYEAYPAGPARNPQSIQRGSVQYLSKYPGTFGSFPTGIYFFVFIPS